MRMKLLLIGIGALALAGCNEGGPGPVAAAPPPIEAMSLPANASCSNEIKRYEDILKADLDTGNVEQRVYDIIQSEMTSAGRACSAGNGREAHAIIARSKAAHGYRA